MSAYESLKSLWKALGIKGQVKNFSSQTLWVLETESGGPIARKLLPGFKTPLNIDTDAFKLIDGNSIEGHKSWWKFYDFSTVEVFDQGVGIEVSAITKTAVKEAHFGNPIYKDEAWGSPIKIVTDIRRDKKGNITKYFVVGAGWISAETALRMTCNHESDNARPVFPKNGRPFIRTRRDQQLTNNLSIKARA
jgi:hypothetical protein